MSEETCTCKTVTIDNSGEPLVRKCSLCQRAPELLRIVKHLADTRQQTLDTCAEEWLGQLAIDARKVLGIK